MSNLTTETKRLRRNTAATAGELREFLASMRGKSPREMLGTVATSNLGKSLVQAAVGVAALIAVLTVIPFGWGLVFNKDRGEPAPPVAIAPATPEEATAEGAADEPKDPLDTLGIGESKPAPLGVNPLEDSTDDLLKDLE